MMGPMLGLQDDSIGPSGCPACKSPLLGPRANHCRSAVNHQGPCVASRWISKHTTATPTSRWRLNIPPLRGIRACAKYEVRSTE